MDHCKPECVQAERFPTLAEALKDGPRVTVAMEFNPLALRPNPHVQVLEDGLTPNQIIARLDLQFTLPFILIVNEEAVMRADWDTPLPAGADCRFLELPRGGGGGKSDPLRVLATVAVVGASMIVPWAFSLTGITASLVGMGIMAGGMLGVNYLFPQRGGSGALASGGTSTDSLTLYSLTANSNAVRLGQPFVEHYGRMIVYPDMAMGSYVRVEGNDVYMYFLGIIGVGHYQVERICIADTPIGDYTGVQFNILQPGATPTLCPALVYTSSEISGQEMEDYDWITATVNPAGTRIHSIEFDVELPNGLVAYSEQSAVPMFWRIDVAVEARAIDDNGEPLTDWVSLAVAPFIFNVTIPLRFSHAYQVPFDSPRWQARFRRTVPKQNNSLYVETIRLTGLRGYGDPHPDYGDVTMFECRVKASEQLNGDISRQINMVATRYLPIVTATGFADQWQPSRCPVDAAAHMVTNANMGRLPQSVLDFPSLYAVKQELAAAGYTFDWRVTSKDSVMNLIQNPARCGRCIACMPGGKFVLIRDKVRPVSFTFTEDHYSEEGLTVTDLPRTDDAPTCYLIRYVNPVTWQEESVYCYDEDGSQDNPEEIDLIGCTSRQQAWEIGMYLYWDDRHNRRSVEFSCGLEGHLAMIGSWVEVTDLVGGWGQSGRIAAIDGSKIWLSEPVDFEGASGVLSLISPAGERAGPYAVSPSQDSAHCVIDTTGALPAWIRPQTTHHTEATPYAFTPVHRPLMLSRITKISHPSRGRVRITASEVKERVYNNPGPAPPVKAMAPRGNHVLFSQLTGDFDDALYVGVFTLSWGTSVAAGEGVVAVTIEERRLNASTLVTSLQFDPAVRAHTFTTTSGVAFSGIYVDLRLFVGGVVVARSTQEYNYIKYVARSSDYVLAAFPHSVEYLPNSVEVFVSGDDSTCPLRWRSEYGGDRWLNVEIQRNGVSQIGKAIYPGKNTDGSNASEAKFTIDETHVAVAGYSWGDSFFLKAQGRWSGDRTIEGTYERCIAAQKSRPDYFPITPRSSVPFVRSLTYSGSGKGNITLAGTKLASQIKWRVYGTALVMSTMAWRPTTLARVEVHAQYGAVNSLPLIGGLPLVALSAVYNPNVGSTGFIPYDMTFNMPLPSAGQVLFVYVKVRDYGFPLGAVIWSAYAWATPPA
ncbi:MAG: phage tail protein [Desulfovibrio sp.]|nr:phage tail protein [Desulfovibrio sp.]